MRKSPAADSPLGCRNGAREWRPAETVQPAKGVPRAGVCRLGPQGAPPGPPQVLGLPLRQGHRTVGIHVGSSCGRTGDAFSLRLRLIRGIRAEYGSATDRPRIHHGPGKDGGGGYYQPYVQAARVETAVVAESDDAEELLPSAAPGPGERLRGGTAASLGRTAPQRRGRPQGVGRRMGCRRARFERACTLLLLPDRADEGAAELVALGCIPPAPSWFAATRDPRSGSFSRIF
jgi:hypothetical protein